MKMFKLSIEGQTIEVPIFNCEVFGAQLFSSHGSSVSLFFNDVDVEVSVELLKRNFVEDSDERYEVPTYSMKSSEIIAELNTTIETLTNEVTELRAFAKMYEVVKENK